MWGPKRPLRQMQARGLTRLANWPVAPMLTDIFGDWGQGEVRLNIPLFSSLSGYRPNWIQKDVSAGLAVAAVGLPSAIAYPAIAGLPPETGIYASIAPLVAYAFFGPSRKLIVGPDAAIMTILAAAITAVL